LGKRRASPLSSSINPLFSAHRRSLGLHFLCYKPSNQFMTPVTNLYASNEVPNKQMGTIAAPSPSWLVGRESPLSGFKIISLLCLGAREVSGHFLCCKPSNHLMRDGNSELCAIMRYGHAVQRIYRESIESRGFQSWLCTMLLAGLEDPKVGQ
jgi:hypothetical protein